MGKQLTQEFPLSVVLEWVLSFRQSENLSIQGKSKVSGPGPIKILCEAPLFLASDCVQQNNVNYLFGGSIIIYYNATTFLEFKCNPLWKFGNYSFEFWIKGPCSAISTLCNFSCENKKTQIATCTSEHVYIRESFYKQTLLFTYSTWQSFLKKLMWLLYLSNQILSYLRKVLPNKYGSQ